MTTIKKENNSFIIQDDKQTLTFPLGTIVMHTSDRSGSIDFKLKGSRKTIYTVGWKYIVNGSGTGFDTKKATVDYVIVCINN